MKQQSRLQKQLAHLESLARLQQPRPEPEQWTLSPEEAEQIASILAEVGALEAVLTAQGVEQ
jgi:hypothetical protein